ncbi:PEP-CTERM sorting domain-containing protein [Pannus brasiliensis CCIBt3594]|uniref:PEP-CTERM sorting domain-containing protein n=1 Tax=Pannus brasiliensis CCIBt3594 TaxID=1427578 RepID=A0AAW9QNH9_9CHRO
MINRTALTSLAVVGISATSWAMAAPVRALTLLSKPTVIDSTPSFNSSYDVSFALDNNLLTDYVSLGGDVNTFIDFDFGSSVLISRVDYTDRASSGVSNGTGGGGDFDNVTSFDLIFSSDSIFGNLDDTIVSVNSPGYANTDVVFINGGNGITARYLRWDVTSVLNSGSNSGAAEFDFYTSTPEPSIIAGLLAVSSIGIFSRKRRG